MDKRKDSNLNGTPLPPVYVKMIEDLFNKNFAKHLRTEKASPKSKKATTELFVAFGQMYPDEVLVVVSLKNPGNLRLTTCYASVDFPPPPGVLTAAGKKPSVSEIVQVSVNSCVDALASFYQAFFDDGRPVDYDTEYRQDWTPLDLTPKNRVFLRVNHDNLELEAQADAILEMDEEVQKKKKLH